MKNTISASNASSSSTRTESASSSSQYWLRSPTTQMVDHDDHSQREPSWCDCPVLTMRLDYPRAHGGSSQVPLPLAAPNWHPQACQSGQPAYLGSSQVPLPTCCCKWHPQACRVGRTCLHRLRPTTNDIGQPKKSNNWQLRPQQLRQNSLPCSTFYSMYTQARQWMDRTATSKLCSLLNSIVGALLVLSLLWPRFYGIVSLVVCKYCNTAILLWYIRFRLNYNS